MTVDDVEARIRRMTHAQSAPVQGPRLPVHIRQRPRPSRGNQFYLDRAQNGAEKTLFGARPSDRDMSWSETRHAKNRTHVECSACLSIRIAQGVQS